MANRVREITWIRRMRRTERRDRRGRGTEQLKLKVEGLEGPERREATGRPRGSAG